MVKSLLAKRDEAIDHLWSLREDPGYFNHYMRESAEHRPELIKDAHDRTHPTVWKYYGSIFWGRVLVKEITRAYSSVEMWSKLHVQVSHLQSIQAQYSHISNPEADLPRLYQSLLLRFHYWLQQYVKGPMEILGATSTASPLWRSCFRRATTSNAAEPDMSTSIKPGIRLDSDQQQLLRLLHVLREDGVELLLVGMDNVIDELQRLLDLSTKARLMVTSYQAELIADLSVANQCMGQVEGYQAWANSLVVKATDQMKALLMEDYVGGTEILTHLHEACEGEAEYHLARHGAPNQVSFYYPADKRATQENINAMRSAEARLDNFWAVFDDMIHQKAVNLEGTAICAVLRGSRALQRTPEFIQTEQHGAKKGMSEHDTLSKPLPEMYYDLQHRTESTIRDSCKVTSSKTKTKTRNALTEIEAATTESNAASSAVNVDDKTQLLEVDQRAFKVFKSLFYTPSLTATPGETSWADFLHAMISTGFQPKKLHGSMWQFASIAPTSRRSIIFHAPHPAGKIPYLVARRHGRRLNRVYGWSSNTFVLAAKEKQTAKDD